MTCGGATIVPDYQEMTAGFVITADPWLVYDVWDKRGKFRGRQFESILVVAS